LGCSIRSRPDIRHFTPFNPHTYIHPIVNKYMKDTDNYGKPKSDYLAKIQSWDDDTLFNETKDKIWLSAYAQNNPRSDYHWQDDAIYDEWNKRNKLGEYSKAYKQVVAANTWPHTK